MTNANLAALSAAGVSVWLDDLSRQLLTSGELEERMSTYSVVGVTTNPAIFQAALADSSAYESALAEAVRADRDVDSVVRSLTTADVRDACDLLAGVFEATDGVDGRVSLEVDPRLAEDTEGTVAQAVELSDVVDRPNLMIKIPATSAGLPAITEVIGRGIDVNVTLIFSADQYRAVAEAYLSGLERAADAGHDLSRIHSVASVFVSRLDTEIDSRLPGDSPLRGTAGLANARLCQDVYDEVYAADGRFGDLAARGARPQRLLWASTGVKDPAYPDTLYVSGLVTHGTVNTMPFATMEAFADHGQLEGDTVRGTGEASRQALEALRAEGIDLDEVFALLERQGVSKFVSAWDDLIATVTARIDEIPSGS
ncbi:MULTISPECIES: transaldolase [unclassified Dietzia]|uniref:transaldolase n=1 Tax=unclassified Dietzia TaxID=2617939 RepID=UPI000D221D4F|nr:MULTISPECIES: transaldolase [unclassified Dietzia]AVZ39464.1 transaldolase [Dietzia sp. JS16-p6b]QGW24743.1 transaldolase [Dietzia sp. DQ12-45-1b]